MKINKVPFVRYAPSPTGSLHLGNARTALYNWIFARSQKGKIFLRIEDTDKARSSTTYSDELINDLKWLGLDFDDDIIWQSKNIKRHQQVVEDLLNKNLAYRCYATATELDALRETAKESGKPFLYDPKWRNQTKKTDRTDYVVRLKVPRNQSVNKVFDLVQGELSCDISQIDDFVLLRTDRTPTYMLSVVVDDHDMGITHIIRGADHITNAFRQSELYKALNWDIPKFAHLPLLHTAEGKMSKRVNGEDENAKLLKELQTIKFYRNHGYLPEALRNALLRLGWGVGNNEIIDDAKAIQLFKISDVGKSPSKFDLAKLNHLNHHYMQHLDCIKSWKLWQNYFSKEIQEQYQERLIKIAPLMFERHDTLEKAALAVKFIYEEIKFPIDEEKAVKVFNDTNIEVIEKWLNIFLTEDDCMASMKKQTAGKEFGVAMRSLRVILTGTMESPNLRSIIDILGKENCIERIKKGISHKKHTIS